MLLRGFYFTKYVTDQYNITCHIFFITDQLTSCPIKLHFPTVTQFTDDISVILTLLLDPILLDPSSNENVVIFSSFTK